MQSAYIVGIFCSEYFLSLNKFASIGIFCSLEIATWMHMARTLIIWTYFVCVCVCLIQEHLCYLMVFNTGRTLHERIYKTSHISNHHIVYCAITWHIAREAYRASVSPLSFRPQDIYIYILNIRATLATKPICLHLSTETFVKVHFHVKHNDMQNRCHWEAGTFVYFSTCAWKTYISTITTLLAIWAKITSKPKSISWRNVSHFMVKILYNHNIVYICDSKSLTIGLCCLHLGSIYSFFGSCWKYFLFF